MEFECRDIFLEYTIKKKCKFILLDWYDGPRELISLDCNVLLLWKGGDVDEWFVAYLTDDLIQQYLSRKIGILTIFNQGVVYTGEELITQEGDFLIKVKEKTTSIKGYPLEDIRLSKNLWQFLEGEISCQQS